MARKTIQALLDDLRFIGGDHYAIVQEVRSLFSDLVPGVEEEVKYGGILFASGAPFGGVFAYKHHVTVEFSHGARIDDPFGHLEGSGKGRRHIKLNAIGDIQAKQLAAYVPLALAATGADVG